MFKRNSPLERLYYEAKPFVYLYLAFAGCIVSGTRFANGCGLLLAACSGLILYWRYNTRQLRGRL